MPMFQLRAVLESLVNDAEDQKIIVDMVENDLRASGYPADEVAAFLGDLLGTAPPKPLSRDVPIHHTTRKLRQPFAMNFEGNADAPDVGTAPAPQPLPKAARGATLGPGGLPHPPSAPRPPSALAGQAFFGKTVMLGHTPELSTAPPQPQPIPKATTMLPHGAPRGTFVFNAPVPKQTVVGVPPAPKTPEAMMPAGQKSLQRHEVMFGGKGLSAGAKPLILIADDDNRARMVFRIRIEEAGYATVDFGDGTAAWERIQQGGVALAVLDMKMPGLHGLEVLANIADKCPGLPVVICTAYDQMQDEQIVKSYSRLKFLVKPVAPEALVKAIGELLGMPSPA